MNIEDYQKYLLLNFLRPFQQYLFFMIIFQVKLQFGIKTKSTSQNHLNPHTHLLKQKKSMLLKENIQQPQNLCFLFAGKTKFLTMTLPLRYQKRDVNCKS